MDPQIDSQEPLAGVSSAGRIAVIGAGRLGTALAGALPEAGVEVEGPLGRGELPGTSRAVIICVPDGEIAAAATVAAGAAPLVGHTSGATPLSALAPAAEAGAALFGFHPLQTFAERAPDGPAPGAAFRGAGCAVAGSTKAPLRFAVSLARRLGMTPFEIDDDGRAAYHAAASVASNFMVTLQAAAESIAVGAGLEPHEARALFIPLLRRTVENLAERGPEGALTGPIARGDHATVEAQRAAVEEVAPHLLDLFDELVRHTHSLARREAPA
jgi:predicted short-subunit dehydrogenase-like oxidoreductase (DUF2520 family)